MGSAKISLSIGATQLNRKRRKKTGRLAGSELRMMWEFESYTRERLRALGIIQ